MADTQALATRTSDAEKFESRRSHFRVLVVEDDDELAELLGSLLTVDGHEALVVHDGVRALEAARSFHPRVILCDVGLPGKLNGHDVARACRKHPDLRNVLLVALTGHAGAEAERCSKEAGFDMHVTKPIGLRGLRRLLDGEVRARTRT